MKIVALAGRHRRGQALARPRAAGRSPRAHHHRQYRRRHRRLGPARLPRPRHCLLRARRPHRRAARAGASATRPSTRWRSMARFGEPAWFGLGDRDLATHLHRTRLLREGRTLTETTADIVAALGAGPARVLPMSDQPVRTRILGPEGWTRLPGVLRARQGADRKSATSGTRARPRRRRRRACSSRHRGRGTRSSSARRIPSRRSGRSSPCPASPPRWRPRAPPSLAVSPIIGGDAVSGPAGRLMAMAGLPVSAAGVARAYAGWLDVLVARRAGSRAGRRRWRASGRPGRRPRHAHDRPRGGDRARARRLLTLIP